MGNLWNNVHKVCHLLGVLMNFTEPYWWANQIVQMKLNTYKKNIIFICMSSAKTKIRHTRKLI